jgi:hypothetical protein
VLIAGISLGSAALFLLVYTSLLVWWVSPNDFFGPTASCVQLQTKVEVGNSSLQATAAHLQHTQQQGGLQQQQQHQQQASASAELDHVTSTSRTQAPAVLGSISRRALTESLEQSLQQLLEDATTIPILGCTSTKLASWKGASQLQANVACVDTNCSGRRP